MSWLTRVQDELTITTGDGKEYSPQYLNASVIQPFNIAEFEFIDLPGTLVDRSEVKGLRYALDLRFQGADHLDDAAAFRLSANDKRAWTIEHPFYGRITVQPVQLAYDNSVQNITKITGEVIETITEDGVTTVTSAVDEIETRSEAVNVASEQAFVTDVQPTASDTQKLAANNTNAYTEGAKYVQGQAAQGYRNAYNTANAKIAEAQSYPADAIGALTDVLTAPARFESSVQNRMELLTNQFVELRSTLENTFTPNEKRIYEQNAATMVNASALAVSLPQESDYTNAVQVLAISDQLADMYAQLMVDLDSLQTDNGGLEESYIPSAEVITALSELVNYTISNLMDIALSAAQERSILCEEDTNAILLTHRLYGLDNADENLNYLIETNKIGLNELLGIKKGRRIVYYV